MRLTRPLACLLVAMPACNAPERRAEAPAPPALECDSCAIRMTAAGILTEPSDSFPILSSTRVALAGDGRYLMAPVGDRAHLALTSATADQATVVFGSRGGGPGEFSNITHAISGGGDSILVLENGSLTLLDAEGEFVLSSKGYSGTFEVIRLGDSYVVSRLIPARAPFILYGSKLEMIREFGDPASRREQMEYRFAHSGSGDLWVARAAANFALLRYNRLLVLVDSIPLVSSWFVPTEEPHRPRLHGSTAWARVNGVTVLEDGNLATVTIIPDRDWLPGESGDGKESGHAMPGPEMYPAMYDTAIEVFDPHTGTLISARRYGGAISGFVGPGLAYERLADDVTGVLYFRLISISTPTPAN